MIAFPFVNNGEWITKNFQLCAIGSKFLSILILNYTGLPHLKQFNLNNIAFIIDFMAIFDSGPFSLARTTGSNDIRFRKLKLRLKDSVKLIKCILYSHLPASGSKHFSPPWLFGAQAARI